MTSGASERGIEVEGDLWAPDHCVHVDPQRGGCVLPPEHKGPHQYWTDPLNEIDDPVEGFIESNEAGS